MAQTLSLNYECYYTVIRGTLCELGSDLAELAVYLLLPPHSSEHTSLAGDPAESDLGPGLTLLPHCSRM